MQRKPDLIHQMFQKTRFLFGNHGSDEHLMQLDGVDDHQPTH